MTIEYSPHIHQRGFSSGGEGYATTGTTKSDKNVCRVPYLAVVNEAVGGRLHCCCIYPPPDARLHEEMGDKTLEERLDWRERSVEKGRGAVGSVC